MKREDPNALVPRKLGDESLPAQRPGALAAGRRRVRAWALVVLAAAIVTAALPQVRWRALVVAEKAVGLQPSITWSDLPALLRTDSGVALSQLAHHRDPYTLLANPHQSILDQEQGGTLFDRQCARCHGAAARGGAGPALVGRALTHGDSDWAMFTTIRNGVAGTPMPAAPLGVDDIWRVIAHLRSIQSAARTRPLEAGLPGGAGRPLLDVSDAMLRGAGAGRDNWLLSSGSYDGKRFAVDSQINAGNVSALRVRWIHQFGTADTRIESVPIVAGRMLYVTLPDGSVIAMDSASGAQVWKFTRPMPPDVRLCCAKVNRGAAVLGRRVFVGTADAHLLALDAATGAVLWDRALADYRQGYSVTSAPLPIGDMVVTGIACGEYPARGFISALDAASGEPRWRFNTIPGPGEPGHETWGGDSWRTGGASTWVTGSYDPSLGLLYWPVGNPAPDFDAAARPGDNLYSESLLALDPVTGRLAWYFQFTPGDDHDYDAAQTPVLVDATEGGAARKLVTVANRNGFFYVLDRTDGHFIRAQPYARQNWAAGISATGRPIDRPEMHPNQRGVFVFPSVDGATNWWPSSYSPLTGLYYVHAHERGGVFFASSSPTGPSAGKLYLGGGWQFSPAEGGYTAVRAIDPKTGAVRWEHRNETYSDLPRGGLLSTAGGLVFGSSTSTFYALDAAGGAVLWSFDTGGPISAAPISFRVDGRQTVAVAAGQMLIAFDLPEQAGPRPTK